MDVDCKEKAPQCQMTIDDIYILQCLNIFLGN